jgi:PIN domain nuclease of toxin-antitoxin system
LNLLLDTQIFLWYIAGDKKLSAEANVLIRDPAIDVFLSAASIWESIIKYQLGKLPLPNPPETYLPEKRAAHKILSLPISESTLLHLPKLPFHHKDPFDRIIICQALENGLTILTADDEIRKYDVPVAGV